MNPDDFEKRLQRQPLRQVPGEWREKILQNAETPRHSSSVIRHSFLRTLNSKLSTLLWPHPKAWAGLAAVWIVIVGLHFAISDPVNQIAKAPEPMRSDAVIVLRQQQQLLAELFGQPSPRDADRPKSNLPQPRSERRTETRFV